MKTLLRSVIKGSKSDDPEFLVRNYNSLREANLDFEIPEDNVIWKFVQDFVAAWNKVMNLDRFDLA